MRNRDFVWNQEYGSYNYTKLIITNHSKKGLNLYDLAPFYFILTFGGSLHSHFYRVCRQLQAIALYR